MSKSKRNFQEAELASVTGATENLRDTAPRLSNLGYEMFKATEQQPDSLHALALSGDAQKQAKLVALILEHEPEIKELADNMATTGQLEPIRVRPAAEKGKYDLVFGARRTLARLYIHAKSGGKIPARLTAEVVEQEDKDALYASISENIRATPSPIDEASSYERSKKSFDMTPKEIGEAMGKGEKVVAHPPQFAEAAQGTPSEGPPGEDRRRAGAQAPGGEGRSRREPGPATALAQADARLLLGSARPPPGRHPAPRHRGRAQVVGPLARLRVRRASGWGRQPERRHRSFDQQ